MYSSGVFSKFSKEHSCHCRTQPSGNQTVLNNQLYWRLIMSLTVPNDGSVMHIAIVTCAVCRGKQHRSMLQFTSCSYPPSPENKVDLRHKI